MTFHKVMPLYSGGYRCGFSFFSEWNGKNIKNNPYRPKIIIFVPKKILGVFRKAL